MGLLEWQQGNIQPSGINVQTSEFETLLFVKFKNEDRRYIHYKRMTAKEVL